MLCKEQLDPRNLRLRGLSNALEILLHAIVPAS